MKAFISSSLLESLDLLDANVIELILEQKEKEEKGRRERLSQEERDIEDQTQRAERETRKAEWEQREKEKDAAIVADRTKPRLVVAEISERNSVRKLLEKVGVVNVEFASLLEKDSLEKFRGVLIVDASEATVEALGLTERNSLAKNYFWGWRWNGIPIPPPKYIYLKGNEATFVYQATDITEIIRFDEGGYRAGSSSFGSRIGYWDIHW